MALHTCVRRRQSHFLFAPNSLIRKLVSLLAVWAMVMGTLPAPAALAETRAEWVNFWKFETAPPEASKAHAVAPTERVHDGHTSAPVARRPFPTLVPRVAALHPPS